MVVVMMMGMGGVMDGENKDAEDNGCSNDGASENTK